MTPPHSSRSLSPAVPATVRRVTNLSRRTIRSSPASGRITWLRRRDRHRQDACEKQDTQFQPVLVIHRQPRFTVSNRCHAHTVHWISNESSGGTTALFEQFSCFGGGQSQPSVAQSPGQSLCPHELLLFRRKSRWAKSGRRAEPHGRHHTNLAAKRCSRHFVPRR